MGVNKTEGVGIQYSNEEVHRFAMAMIDGIFSDLTGGNTETAIPVVNDKQHTGNVKTKKETYSENIRFSYYGCVGQCTKHNGVFVIASNVDVELGVVFYGISYCSPKDVYDKHIGKSLAMADLDDLKNVELAGKKHHEINARIFSDIIANNDAPSWAVGMISRELINHLSEAFND